jgi:hypothetical protein
VSISVGLHDQRIRVYERVNVNEDGRVRTVFQFRAEWWGRVDDRDAQMRSVGARQQMLTNGLAEFADEVTLYVGGVLKDETGTLWWVQGIYGARLARNTMAGVLRLSEEQVKTFVGIEGASTLDGVHLTD